MTQAEAHMQTEARLMEKLLAIVTELRHMHAELPREAVGREAFPRIDLLYELAHGTRCLERVGARWGVQAQEPGAEALR